MQLDDVFPSAPHAASASARASVHIVSDFVDIATGAWRATPDRPRYVLRHLLGCVECQNELSAMIRLLASDHLPPDPHWTAAREMLGVLLDAVIERRVRPQIDAYIEVRLAADADAANAAFPELAAHLARCAPCREEVELSCGVLEAGRAADCAWGRAAYPAPPPDPAPPESDPADDSPSVPPADLTEVAGSWPLESEEALLVYATAGAGEQSGWLTTAWYELQASIRRRVIVLRSQWSLTLGEHDVWADVVAVASSVSRDTLPLRASRHQLDSGLARHARQIVEGHVVEDLLRNRASPCWDRLYLSMVQGACRHLGYRAGQLPDHWFDTPMRPYEVLPVVLAPVMSDQARDTIMDIANRAVMKLHHFLARRRDRREIRSLEGVCARLIATATSDYLRGKDRADQRHEAAFKVTKRQGGALWDPGLTFAFSELQHDGAPLEDEIEGMEEGEERDLDVPSAGKSPEDVVVARETHQQILQVAVSAITKYAQAVSRDSEGVARRVDILSRALIRNQHNAVIAEHLGVTRQQVRSMVGRFRSSPTTRDLLDALDQERVESQRPRTRTGTAPGGKGESKQRKARHSGSKI